jgi:hypothetical protein
MHTILVAATLAASTAGAQTPGHHHRTGCCLPGFAPAVHNGRLVTPPVEDQSRVYTPGASSVRARLWVSDDVKDVASRRAWRQNPGRVAYGAADAGHERVHVRVYNQKVSVSAWQKIEGEGLANFEAARQQWLAERGLTGGVRTFVHPRACAMAMPPAPLLLQCRRPAPPSACARNGPAAARSRRSAPARRARSASFGQTSRSPSPSQTPSAARPSSGRPHGAGSPSAPPPRPAWPAPGSDPAAPSRTTTRDRQ